MTKTRINTEVKPKDFVYLSDFNNTIKIDIKYATNDNFTGSIVPGYLSNTAILTEDAANKLHLVQEELILDKLGLNSLLVW
jgi:D-alanyl-D-alanine dipeptidase